MPNFVDDDVELPYPKSQSRAVPAGREAYYVSATEWNTVCQALIDLRDKVREIEESVVPRRLILICGQSNSQTIGLVSALSDPSYAAAYPAVPYMAKQDGNTNPPVWTEYPLGDLDSVTYNSADRIGIEASLMRDLDSALPGKWACARFSLGGTSLSANWDPNGTYPNTEPKNLFTQFIEYAQSAISATGSTLAAVIWIQGENDAGGLGTANAYDDNLVEFVSMMRAELGAVPFIFGRLNAGYTGGAYTTELRASQANAAALIGSSTLVDQDSVALSGDGVHYDADGLIALGHLYATAVAVALGINLPPVAAFSTSVEGLGVTFTDESTDADGAIVSRAWSFGDGNTSSGANPTHTYESPGSYLVSLTVTDNGGRTNTTSQSVSVSAESWSVDAESGKPMPVDATEFAALMEAGDLAIVPSSLYLPGADAGSPLVDRIADFDLTLAGSGAGYGVDVVGWDADAATLTEGTTGGFRSLSTSLPDISAASCLLLARVRMPSSIPSALRLVMFLGVGTVATVRINPATGFLSTTSGGNVANGAVNVCTGGVLTIVLQVHRTGTIQRAFTPTEKLSPTFASGLTGKAVYLGSNSTAPDVGYLYAVRLDGSEAELTEAEVKALFERHGDAVIWVPA